MRQKIKIAFSDFWGGFEYNPTNKSDFDNVIYKILSEKFDIEISNNPDILIYSVFGYNHQHYNCKKVFYTGENTRPNYNECDYSITFDYLEDNRNIRFPLSAITLYENEIFDKFEKNIDFERVNFVISFFQIHQLNIEIYYLMNYRSIKKLIQEEEP